MKVEGRSGGVASQAGLLSGSTVPQPGVAQPALWTA